MQQNEHNIQFFADSQDFQLRDFDKMISFVSYSFILLFLDTKLAIFGTTCVCLLIVAVKFSLLRCFQIKHISPV